ncbi:hypothetical protein SpCBS45565_g00921 [Spizellomyces sp. 'palustris']|nr:hypothetical protein SpCBS45565_g00921 [Spizellomyces sp. 'palustris']
MLDLHQQAPPTIPSWGDQHGGIFETPYYYTLSDLAAHAKRTGFSEGEEMEAMQKATRVLGRVYRRLKIPAKTFATASYLLHRFYAVWPRKSPYYTDEEVCLACIDMACKLEETPIGMSQLAQYVLCESRGVRMTESEAKTAVEGKLAPHQQKLLEAVQFDTNIVHPFSSCAKFVKQLAAVDTRKKITPKNLYQRASYIILDSYSIPLCIQFPPHVIAMASLYLVSKFWSELPAVESEFVETVCCRMKEVEGKSLGLASFTDRYFSAEDSVPTDHNCLDAAIQLLEMYLRTPSRESSPSLYKRALDELQERVRSRPPSLYTSPATPGADAYSSNSYPTYSPHSPHSYSSYYGPASSASTPTEERYAGHKRRRTEEDDYGRRERDKDRERDRERERDRDRDRDWDRERERERERDRDRERERERERDRDRDRDRMRDRDRDRDRGYREYEGSRRRGWKG